jgi:hypothetical protein
MSKDAKMHSERTGPISPAHAGAIAARKLILEEDCRERAEGANEAL